MGFRVVPTYMDAALQHFNLLLAPFCVAAVALTYGIVEGDTIFRLLKSCSPPQYRFCRQGGQQWVL